MARLATVLDADRPLYYLRPPAITDRAELDRVDDWLAHFRTVIAGLAVAPPYRLLGYSFGGVLALELARGYRERGIGVAYVGMVDTWRPEVIARTMSEKVVEFVTRLDRAPRGMRRSVVAEFAKRSVRYRAGKVRERVRPTLAPRDVLPPIRRAVMVSWARYQPTAVDFPVALFACPKSMARFGRDPSLGWAPFLRGGFTQCTVAGEHLTLFTEPYLDGTVAAIEESLHPPARLAESVAD